MTYDPAIIVNFAERLYAQANRIIVLVVLLGVVVGVSAGFALDVATKAGPVSLFLGGTVGGLVGFAVGSERAFRLKLDAQRALCELQTEINTRALLVQRQPAQPQHAPQGPRGQSPQDPEDHGPPAIRYPRR